jgi:hypothetical protein
MGENVVILGSCRHERKALTLPGTANYTPTAAIICAVCMQRLVTIDEARLLVAAADDRDGR